MAADEPELVSLHRQVAAAFAAGDPVHPRELLRLHDLFARFGFTPTSRAAPSAELVEAISAREPIDKINRMSG